MPPFLTHLPQPRLFTSPIPPAFVPSTFSTFYPFRSASFLPSVPSLPFPSHQFSSLQNYSSFTYSILFTLSYHLTSVPSAPFLSALSLQFSSSSSHSFLHTVSTSNSLRKTTSSNLYNPFSSFCIPPSRFLSHSFFFFIISSKTQTISAS